MLKSDCNSAIMLSSDSETVKNDMFLSKLEKKLHLLSNKYGLGEVYQTIVNRAYFST